MVLQMQVEAHTATLASICHFRQYSCCNLENQSVLFSLFKSNWNNGATLSGHGGMGQKKINGDFSIPLAGSSGSQEGGNISSPALGEYGCSSKADVALDMLGSLSPSGLVRELTLSLPLSHKRGHPFRELFLSQSPLLLSLAICKYI